MKECRLLVRFSIHILETSLRNLHLVEDAQSISEGESELCRVKEQLRNAESIIAHLSDKVTKYRYRWLEEYYRAENLNCHMPCNIYVPDLPQIALGIPSPSCSEFLKWDEAGEDPGQVDCSDEEHPL